MLFLCAQADPALGCPQGAQHPGELRSYPARARGDARRSRRAVVVRAGTHTLPLVRSPACSPRPRRTRRSTRTRRVSRGRARVCTEAGDWVRGNRCFRESCAGSLGVGQRERGASWDGRPVHESSRLLQGPLRSSSRVRHCQSDPEASLLTLSLIERKHQKPARCTAQRGCDVRPVEDRSQPAPLGSDLSASSLLHRPAAMDGYDPYHQQQHQQQQYVYAQQPLSLPVQQPAAPPPLPHLGPIASTSQLPPAPLPPGDWATQIALDAAHLPPGGTILVPALGPGLAAALPDQVVGGTQLVKVTAKVRPRLDCTLLHSHADP